MTRKNRFFRDEKKQAGSAVLPPLLPPLTDCPVDRLSVADPGGDESAKVRSPDDNIRRVDTLGLNQ